MDKRVISALRVSISCALVCTTLVCFSGCSGPVRRTSPAQAAVASQAAQRDTALTGEIDTWLGTPHRMGGETRRGADCSGMVMAVYEAVYGIRLPRTTVAQMRTGRWVSRAALMPGDLVFFKPKHKYHHVGIYIGDGGFVHTSSSRGVIISRLDDDFWHACYLTGRRLLSSAQ